LIFFQIFFAKKFSINFAVGGRIVRTICNITWTFLNFFSNIICKRVSFYFKSSKKKILKNCYSSDRYICLPHVAKYTHDAHRHCKKIYEPSKQFLLKTVAHFIYVLCKRRFCPDNFKDFFVKIFF